MTRLRLAQFILASLILWAVILAAIAAFAADYRYCAGWARDYVKFLESRAYSYCLVREVDKLTLPSNETWLALMLRLEVMDKGTAPATADPTPSAAPKWVTQCRKDYRSFNSEDGTVIRRGARKRTPCPHKPG